MGSGDSLEGNRRQPRQRLRIQASFGAGFPRSDARNSHAPRSQARPSDSRTVGRLPLGEHAQVICLRRNSRPDLIPFLVASSCVKQQCDAIASL